MLSRASPSCHFLRKACPERSRRTQGFQPIPSKPLLNSLEYNSHKNPCQAIDISPKKPNNFFAALKTTKMERKPGQRQENKIYFEDGRKLVKLLDKIFSRLKTVHNWKKGENQISSRNSGKRNCLQRRRKTDKRRVN